MSLYSAMYAGVSGLKSQSTAMATIGDNIANVSTVGYKTTDTAFSTLVTKNATSTSYSAGGVLSVTQQNVDVQGSLSASSSTSDIAISGSGFFVVNTVAEPTSSSGLFCYTRAGSFTVDQNGYLTNSSGYYLMGWPLQVANGSEPSTSLVEIEGTLYSRSYTLDDGSTYYVNTNVVDSNELQALNLNTIGGTAQPTLNVALGANLPADYDVGSAVETTVSVYDAFGITHNVDWTWTKTSANNWDLALTPASDSATVELLNEDDGVYYAAGQLEFTGVWDGATTIADIDGISFDVSFDGGGTTTTYTLDSTVLMGASAAGTIGISDATSWADVCDTIATLLNADDIAGGTTGQFGSGTVATTGGPNDDGTRFASDGYKSVSIVQSGDGDDIIISNFTDGTAGGDMNTYLVTSNVNNGSFTVSQLDQTNGNYWGATTAGITNLAAVTFNGDGTPDTINVASMEVVWANGAQDMTGEDKVTLFLGNENLTDGLIQLSAPYEVSYLTQDGAKFGNFAGIDIGTDGTVTALFDNGVRVAIFQIPIATFVNPNGMEGLTGNAYIETDNSGSYVLQNAGNSGAGTVQAGALETSTVDLSTEFTTMIVTQRAYSAASKVITTANDMMDDLLAIVR